MLGKCEYTVLGISGSKFVVFRLKTGGNTHCFRRFAFITSYVRTITAKSRCKIVMHGHPKVELSNIFHLKQYHGTSGPSKSINVPYQGVKYTFSYHLCQIHNPQLGVLMTFIIMLKKLTDTSQMIIIIIIEVLPVPQDHETCQIRG